MRRRALAVLLFVAAASAAVWLRSGLDSRNEREMLMDMAYLPNGRMLSWMSGGMDDILSDILWLRTLRYIMDHFDSDRDYTFLYRAHDIITDLDPQFIRAYRFGGLFLTGITDEYDNAITLLEKGWRENPGRWDIAYDLGTIYNFNKKDPAAAAEWFARASKDPACPSIIREHATAIYEDEGRLRRAREMWTDIYRNAGSESLREVADWNVKKIESLILLEDLKALLDVFKSRTGSLPGSLEDLRTAGLIRAVPKDAFGEEFVYTPARAEADPDEMINSRELIRRILDKRMIFFRYAVRRFRHEKGMYPASLTEALSKSFLQNVPYGIRPDYDPETGEVSYDRTLENYGL